MIHVHAGVRVCCSPFGALTKLVLTTFHVYRVEITDSVGTIAVTTVTGDRRSVKTLLTGPSECFRVVCRSENTRVVGTVPEVVRCFFGEDK